MKDLKVLLDDTEGSVRTNVYEALYGISRTREGASSLVQTDYVGTFVLKVDVEEADVQVKILQTIHNCVADVKGLQDALASKAVEMTIRLVESKDPNVRYATADPNDCC